MSWLSKATGIHINLKPLAAPIGAAVGSVIPGVGTALGAGLGQFLSGVGNGQSVGKSALGGLAAGAGGAALSGLGGLASKIPGVSALGSLPGVSQVGNALGGIKNVVGNIPGISSIGDAFGKLGGEAGSFLTSNGGLNALGAAQGVNAALLGKQSSDYAKNAMGSVNQSYGERAPLRTAGIAGMLHPQIPDLSPLGAIAGNNPYARKISPPMAGAA